MEHLKPPIGLNVDGDLDAHWRAFKQQFVLYLTATDGDEKSDEKKVAMLLTIAGESAIDIFNTFSLTAAEKKDLKVVLEKFDNYCSPRKNEVYERYVFRCRNQKEGEQFDQFVTDIRLKARTCNFENQLDSMIRDQIVFGTNSKAVREKLLRQSDLTLDKTIKVGLAHELAQSQLRVFECESMMAGPAQNPSYSNSDVNAVTGAQKKTSYQNRWKGPGKWQPGPRLPAKQQPQSDCKWCGTVHQYGRCPAYGRTCDKCYRQNHFASVCYSGGNSNIDTRQGNPKRVNMVDCYEDELNGTVTDNLFIGSVDNEHENDVVSHVNDVVSHDNDVLSHDNDVVSHENDVVSHENDVVSHDNDVVSHDNDVLSHDNDVVSHENDVVSHENDAIDIVSDDVEFRGKLAGETPHRVNTVKEEKWIVPLEVNKTIVPMKLDTGAKVNLISEEDVYNLQVVPKIKPSRTGLKAYNDTPIESKGMCWLTVKVKGTEYKSLFIVVPKGRMSLLGERDCERLGFVKRVYMVHDGKADIRSRDAREPTENQSSIVGMDVHKQFPGVFTSSCDGMNALPYTYTIKMEANVVPVVHAARRVPIALRGDVKKELARMESLNVISKIEEPTDWVSSMVVIRKKNNALRICLDPKDLNACVKREHYPIPRKDDIIAEMVNATVFSKLDASHGFWQVKLDEHSSKLCTFNTPFGRYRFLRLPFGIKSAPEIFHRAMELVFEGLEGVRVYIDDVAIWGRSQAEHDERLSRALERVQQHRLQLNKDKCEFSRTHITFLGEKLSAQGTQPDPERVEVIRRLMRPLNKKDLQRFFGMLNFVGKFIPNLATKTSILRTLLTDKVDWQWSENHEKEWKHLTEVLSSKPVLQFFDPSKPIKISTDASKDGLGAVLLQQSGNDWAPVAYAARSMSSAEKRYAQIEKECLGLTFGCEKFHDYVYGLVVDLETDHKPLVSIVKKNLCDMSPRIQCMMMKIQRYDFKLSYTPGKLLVVADTLSRAAPPLNVDIVTTETDVAEHSDLFISMIDASEKQLDHIVMETLRDPILQKVIGHMDTQWPRGTCPQYFEFRDELSVIDGILLKGSRIVIPMSMQSEMLHRIHEGHQGIEKCKRRARASLYWPGMCTDIENMISVCAICQKYRYQQPKETMITANDATEPWEKVGLDLFQLAGKDYLIAIDYMSNYPEVALLNSCTSSSVIMHLKSFFARHGIPRRVVSDNGPQFSSYEFKKFAQTYEFEHIPSSPYFAQSNGKAEKGVQIIKRLWAKSNETKTDPYLALLNYRSSPLSNGRSPAELLMNRTLRTRLPCLKAHLPTTTEESTQKRYYDRTAHDLHPLTAGNVVRLRSDNKWNTRGAIQAQVAPRSYEVLTEDGKTFIRNRRHLLQTNEGIDFEDSADETPPLVDLPHTSPSNIDSPIAVPVKPPDHSITVSPRRSSRSNKGQHPKRLVQSM